MNFVTARIIEELSRSRCFFKAIRVVLAAGLVFLPLLLRGQSFAQIIRQEHLRDYEAITLQLPFTDQFQFAGYYAAIEKGFYAQEGLVVNLREPDGDTPVDAVLSGKAQYGITGSELVVDRIHGKPVVALGVIFQHSPYAILADFRSGIHQAKDLAGKRLMMELNQRDVEMEAMLKKAGVDMSRIQIKRNTGNVDDLLEHRADAMGCYITNEPFHLKKLNVPYTLLQPKDYGIDFYGDCFFTTEAEIQTNPERAAAFQQASIRGWNYAMEHPDEIIQIILDKYGARKRGLTAEDLQYEASEMRKLIVPELVPIGQMHPERWEQIAETYADLGFVQRPFSLDNFVLEPVKTRHDYWLYWLRAALCGAVLVALIVLLWNMQLRRQVEKRTEQLRLQNKEIQREAQALRKAEEDLKASEMKFRRIYDANIMGMFYATKEGNIIEANEAFLKLLGYTREDLDQGLLQSQLFLDPEYHPLEPKALKEIEERGVCTPYEKDLVCRDGSSVPTIITAAMVTPQDKSVVAIVQDISEKKRLLEEQVKTSKLEAIGVLAGGIAHDFNNLLTPILGNLSLARNTSDNTPGIDSFLQLAEKACWRARDLTQQLLTFSRGGAPVKKASVLSDLIRDSTHFALHGSNVRALFDIADSLAAVDADQGQLSQVIQNLVINAVHAMPQGGALHVNAFNVEQIEHPNLPPHPGQYVCIEVQDEGTGIQPDNLKKIFDPYFTTKSHGHGLGLATSFSIIRRHDGYIGVKSQWGKGSTFSIFLPVSRNNVKAETREGSMVKAHSHGGHVLVMDDEKDIRQLVHDMLDHSGYDVATACNGEEVIHLYTEAKKNGKPFDVVILDLTVPGGLGGAETLVALREFDPEVKAIVCSGYSNDPIIAEYAKHHFRAAVSKPFSFDHLISTIATVIAEK